MPVSRIDTLFLGSLSGALRDIGSFLFTLNLFKGRERKKKKTRARVTCRKAGNKRGKKLRCEALSLVLSGRMDGNETDPFKYLWEYAFGRQLG